MDITCKNHRIYFDYEGISSANISMKGTAVCLELIKTLPKFRNKKYATKLLLKIIEYVLKRKNFTHIYLNPLPLETKSGLDLEQLIKFYSKHGFKASNDRDIHSPYLMVKKLKG